MSIETYHIPVMLQECIEGLDIKPNGTYVDLTMGGGGHTSEILRHLGPEGHLYSFDQDPDAQANAPQDERFTFVASCVALCVCVAWSRSTASWPTSAYRRTTSTLSTVASRSVARHPSICV